MDVEKDHHTLIIGHEAQKRATHDDVAKDLQENQSEHTMLICEGNTQILCLIQMRCVVPKDQPNGLARRALHCASRTQQTILMCCTKGHSNGSTRRVVHWAS